MASVTYKIGGKYDGKGIKSAKKDLSDLATVVKGLAVVKIAQELNKVAQATKGVFTAQNQALTQFNTAVAKSGLELKKLNDIKKQVSNGNFIDDDSINKVMTYGMQMGLNAEQIEKVTKASINMASAGVKPLDKAMKELTKTALTNEDALDGIVAQYDGFADAMSRTFSGRDTQWKNSIAGLQAGIGGIAEGLEFIAKGKFIEPLNKITEWIVKNRENILKTILNLPKILQTLLNGILSGDFLMKLGVNLYNTLILALKNTFSFLGTLIDTTLSSIGNGLYAIFEDTKLGELIKNVLSGNGGKNQIDRQKRANEILKNAGIGASQQLKLTDAELEQLGLERVGGKNSKTYATKREQVNYGTDAINKNIEKLAQASITSAKDWKSLITGFWENMADVLDNQGTLEEIRNIINNSDLPDDLKEAFQGITYNPTNETEITTTNDKKRENNPSVVGTAALGFAGEIGSIVQSVMQNGIWGAIAELLSKILKKVEEVSPLFQFFENIFTELIDILINPDSGLIKSIEKAIKPFMDGFNAVKDIFSGILDVVASIIDAFTPILQGLTMILNKIAPVIVSILQVITLLFKVIGQIGEMLNPILQAVLEVLTPVLEIINVIIKAIYKIIATIVNVVVDIYNAIKPFWAGSLNHVSTDVNNSSVFSGYAGYNLPSNYATESAAASSHNATYNTARDIYLNVIFDHSFVNSDGREVALMIRDEIRSAERLGY